MSLQDDIRSAQIRAGEDMVIRNLERLGLASSPPVQPAAPAMDDAWLKEANYLIDAVIVEGRRLGVSGTLEELNESREHLLSHLRNRPEGCAGQCGTAAPGAALSSPSHSKNLGVEPLNADTLLLHEALKGGKPGEFLAIDPELIRRVNDRALAAALPAIIESRRNQCRLSWLHSEASNDVYGYEWGIYRVKWANGSAVEVWQTKSDFSDLDAAMQAPSVAQQPDTVHLAAPQTSAAPEIGAEKYDDVLVPFVALMRKELHANCGKGDRPGWLAIDANTALLEVYYHLAKLQKAVRNNDGPSIQEYSADVANMAMMVLDICGGLAWIDAAQADAAPAGQAAPAKGPPDAPSTDALTKLLALVAELKPMAAYGVVGSRDVDQVRHQRTIAEIESVLGALTRTKEIQS
jgi:hypothetical protein